MGIKEESVMVFTPGEKMQIKNAVERALHVPGNYNGGTLEMAMIFDCNLSEECVRETGKAIAVLLKSHGEVFRNVRLNIIWWEGDEELAKEVISIPHLQMGRCFDGYRCIENKKRVELLAGQLKKFYARSKIILLFTDGNCRVEEEELWKENMYPFLYRKLVVIQLCIGKQDADNRLMKIHTGMRKGWTML